MQIPVITLHQPYAQFIMMGWKIIETRPHNRFKSLEGKTIFIHAGAHWEKNWYQFSGKYMTDDQVRQTVNWSMFKRLKPQIVCSVFVKKNAKLNSECESKKALIDCYEKDNRYGLFLINTKVIDPIIIKGSQGIWHYNLETLK